MRRAMCGSRLLSSLLLASVLWTPVAHPKAAEAQGQPVVIRLQSQSPWNGPDRPLSLSFAATNHTDQALGDLSVLVSILTPARSRSLYELSLRQDATGALFTVPFLEEGTLEPGATRTFRIEQALDVLTARNESALYPVKVELRSADVTQATMRTPMVFLIEPPEVPLHLAWTWVLDGPLQRGPDGVVQRGPLPGVLAPGGRLDAMLSALDTITPGPVDVAVSPVLADQLDAMAQGYRAAADASVVPVPRGTGGAADAQAALDTLRLVVGRPGTELVALPFGDARIPALIESGLLGDVEGLMRAGRDRVSEVLGASPDPAVFRPPFSQVEVPSAEALAGSGVRILLLDAATIPPDENQPFAPPSGSARPVVRLAGIPALSAVTPDPGVASIAAAFPQDPRLAAQAALGELAAVWLEFPGTPGRGAALVFSEESPYPPQFIGAFSRLVTGSPWLRTVRASQLVSTVGGAPEVSLPRHSFRSLPFAYRAGLLEARRSLDQFERTVGGAADLVARLRSDLLLAEGGVALANVQLGRRYIASVQRAISGTFGRIRPPPFGVPFTLTSQAGSLPLTVGNESPYPMRVAVRLIADRRLVFPRGNIREVTLPGNEVTLVRIPVQAVATGRFPVKVQVLTAGTGAQDTIAESELIIRSTAYNRIALLLTIGAAAFLLAWWVRRFLPGGRGGAPRGRPKEAGA